MKNIQRSTVKALFRRKNGEVLIAKSSRDEFWELPGGKIEFNEQPEETLRREVFEEFSIKDFEIVKLLGMFSFEAIDKYAHWHFVVSIFLCNLQDEDLKISNEHENFKWIQPSKIRDVLMRDGYYKVIESL